MPYVRQWDPNVMGDCGDCQNGTVWVPMHAKGMDGPPEMVPRPCGNCTNGRRRVGGYVQVWVEPDPPTKK